MALFKDKNGNMIEVTDVIFFPQGGGLEMRMTLETFRENFEPVTEPHPYKLVSITAEWLAEGVTIPAYWNGMRWNGWATPWFPVSSLPLLAAAMPQTLAYDEASGELTLLDPAGDFEGEGNPVMEKDIYVDGNPVPVVGFDGWCWEVKGEDDAE